MAMTDRYETRAVTHADDCWSWGPGHYECAVGRIERDEALLRQALERLEAIVEHFDPYMGDNECRPMENARSTIAALRERLGEGAEP